MAKFCLRTGSVILNNNIQNQTYFGIIGMLAIYAILAVLATLILFLSIWVLIGTVLLNLSWYFYGFAVLLAFIIFMLSIIEVAYKVKQLLNFHARTKEKQEENEYVQQIHLLCELLIMRAQILSLEEQHENQ